MPLCRGTTLQYIKDRMNVSPINALQNRVSAHFTEINSMYLHEMTKKLIDVEEQIESEWKSESDEARRTKYAREGYRYIAPHSNAK